MKQKPWLGYTLYGIAVTLFFLYVLFPAAILERFFESTADRWLGLTLTVDSARLIVPPGIAMAKSEVALAGRPDLVMVARDVVLKPKLTDLVRGKLAVNFRFRSCGGGLSGTAAFSRRFACEGPMDVQMLVSDVDLSQTVWLEHFFGRQVRGVFRGSADLEGFSVAPPEGTGEVDLYLEQGSFPLPESFMGFDRIDFNQIHVRADIESSVLNVRTINFNGDGITGMLNGSVHFHRHLPSSRIAFRGSLTHPSIGGSVSLNLGGTLAQPRVRVGRS